MRQREREGGGEREMRERNYSISLCLIWETPCSMQFMCSCFIHRRACEILFWKEKKKTKAIAGTQVILRTRTYCGVRYIPPPSCGKLNKAFLPR